MGEGDIGRSFSRGVMSFVVFDLCGDPLLPHRVVSRRGDDRAFPRSATVGQDLQSGALCLFVPSFVPGLSMAGGSYCAALGGLPYFAAFGSCWELVFSNYQKKA
jgi:hypothetical protein